MFEIDRPLLALGTSMYTDVTNKEKLHGFVLNSRGRGEKPSVICLLEKDEKLAKWGRIWGNFSVNTVAYCVALRLSVCILCAETTWKLKAFSLYLTENVDFNNGLFMQKLFARFEERFFSQLGTDLF